MVQKERYSNNVKLNLGCGKDIREGYLNIDFLPIPGSQFFNISSALPIGNDVEEILMIDILEHFEHFIGERLLRQGANMLRKGGVLRITTPDPEAILDTKQLTIEEKIRWLYGGQDEPGKSPVEEYRKDYPEMFCHRYLWTREKLGDLLVGLGLTVTGDTYNGWNYRVIGVK